MSTPFCSACYGSGESGESGRHGTLDCTAPGCTAAEERRYLGQHLLAIGPLPAYDREWEAYKLGQVKGEAAYIARAAAAREALRKATAPAAAETFQHFPSPEAKQAHLDDVAAGIERGELPF